METLPLELLDQIITNVAIFDREDGLCNLRLVNKQFNNLTTPKTFASISLWLGSKSLRKLAELSKHRGIVQYVKAIRFSPLQFHTPHDARQSSSLKYHELEKQVERGEIEPSQLLQYVDDDTQHGRFLKAQELLYTSSAVNRVLKAAFQRLDMVRTIDIVLDCRITGSNELTTTFNMLDCNRYRWDQDNPLPFLFEALDALPSPLSTFRFRYDNDTTSNHQTKYLKRSRKKVAYEASYLGTRMLALYTKKIDWTRLEDLELHYSERAQHDYQNHEDGFDQYLAATADIFRKSSRLKSLRLQVPSNALASDLWNSHAFNRLMGEIPLSRLTSLALLDLSIWIVDLLTKLIKERTFTPRTIYLECFDEAAYWASFLEAQRRIQWNDLKSFRMCFFSGESWRCCYDVTSYVRMQTEENPLDPGINDDGDGIADS
ncbi:uncharacterized protein KY384_006270 [Bacidia gigantensis]|uniref:uncharacterized protein n=1 Tax=Bacidia gigantensis TaxID=2732470 RepID=UPI001D04D0E8|nr:uncharacterized protein KY384_006270 [Bacidia gigantensis]KAG8528583.1 hypothetical protein KY384_006270 [Bacidia gigantensis]